MAIFYSVWMENFIVFIYNNEYNFYNYMEEKWIKLLSKKCPSGDTRTAVGEVSFEEFSRANDLHKQDVKNILFEVSNFIKEIGIHHDWTKKQYEKQFYKEFTEFRRNNGNFSNDSKWYQNHIRQERHHINCT